MIIKHKVRENLQKKGVKRTSDRFSNTSLLNKQIRAHLRREIPGLFSRFDAAGLATV
jgi:hypothetical protein